MVESKTNTPKNASRKALSHTLTRVASIVFSLTLAGLVIWIAVNERNLFRWNPMHRHIFWGLAAFSILIPAIVLLDILKRKKRSSKSALGIYSYILIGIGIIIPVLFMSSLAPYSHTGDKPVQLIMADQQNSSGLPDVAVVWYTKKPSQHTLYYGTDPSKLDLTIQETQKSRSHALVLSDLYPGNTYYYKISESGEISSFTYFPSYQDGIRIAISSDAHIGADDNREDLTINILQNIADSKNSYSVFFNLGDAVEMGNDDDQYTQQISLFSPYTSSVPLIQVPGNHDGWFRGIEFWKEYYCPKALPSESSGSQLFHRYDFGDSVHLFTLDLEWGIETYTDAQRDWFEHQLELLDPDDLIIVMNHAFYYASSTEYDGMPWYDNQEMIELFHPLYVAHGVDLVFSGHDHQMEHISQDGVEYFIVGVLGGHLDKEPTYISTNSVYRNFQDHGYADLIIQDDSVSLDFRSPDGVSVYSWSETR